MRLFTLAAELSVASLISFVRNIVMLEQEESIISTRQNSKKRNFMEAPLNCVSFLFEP